MADQQFQPWPLVNATIRGPTIVAYGPMRGGYIQNPASAADQGVPTAENIYVSIVGPPGLFANTSTVAVPAGFSFVFPGPVQSNVYVNAPTVGHRISGVVIQDAPGFQPVAGNWPPSTYTTLTALIQSYLYQQYNDDEDLQVFVSSFNDMAQQYITWFSTVMLPVYTNPNVNTELLDWVAYGLYGQKRPSLPSGLSRSTGPLNTLMLNALLLNGYVQAEPTNFYITDDDLFRRILTWHLWKGDGKLFDIRWLKRRVKRFLTGTDGGPGQTDTTYEVSVTFGPTPRVVNINLQSTRRVAIGGATLNSGMLNTFMLNELLTTTLTLPSNPFSEIFKAAVEAGVLELPFQFTYNVNLN